MSIWPWLICAQFDNIMKDVCEGDEFGKKKNLISGEVSLEMIKLEVLQHVLSHIRGHSEVKFVPWII